MTVQPILNDALRSLLSDHGPAVVAALGDDGFRVELPATFELGGHQALAGCAERATMLDLVVPDDRLAVVDAWERAQPTGIAATVVRLLADPGRRLNLSFVDDRPRVGAWLAVLTDDGVGDAGSELLADRLVVPSRPRQATLHKSMTAIITAVDERVTRMLGWAPEEMLGRRSTEFIHPGDRDRAVAAWMALLGDREGQRIRLRHRRADGGWLWVEAEHEHNGAERAEDVDVVARLTDISAEMAVHDALHRREQLFSRLAEALPTGVLQLQHDRSIAYANARLASILGVPEVASAADVLAVVAAVDRAALEAALAAALECGEDAELEVEVRPGGGIAHRHCALTIAAVGDQEGRPAALICVSDVTESAHLREELEARATYDALTGCLNRASVLHALDRRLARGGGADTAVLFVDLDRFKPVNDRLGHLAGDELLVEVARRLRELTRGEDVVGRLGGDEFLLVCCGLDLPADAHAIAERVSAALRGPVTLRAGTVDLRASVGVACAQPGVTRERLVSRADAAMYASKREGHGHPAFADPDTRA